MAVWGGIFVKETCLIVIKSGETVSLKVLSSENYVGLIVVIIDGYYFSVWVVGYLLLIIGHHLGF